MVSKMYLNSSIENGWANLANSFFAVFAIVRTRFLRKNILQKPSTKVENLDVKNSGALCPEINKLNNKNCSLLVQIKLIIVYYSLVAIG